jgi:hypothetical protein
MLDDMLTSRVGGGPSWSPSRLAANVAGNGSRTAKVEAMEFLQAALAGGPVAAAEINRMAREHGLTPKTVRSAREALKVKIERNGFGPGSRVLWSLPNVP